MHAAATSRVDHGVLPYAVDKGVGTQARIGLVALTFDQTIEYEVNRLLMRRGVATYCTRITAVSTITPETLKRMEIEIRNSVRLLPPDVDLEVVAFGCTSAALVIGSEPVAQHITSVRPGVKVTDPMTSAFAALAQLDAHRIGLLTPYIEDINRPMREAFEARGYEVSVVGTFDQPNDAVVARIDARSIRDALVRIGRHAECDAVFMSCTSLRGIDILEDVEREIGKPVTTSNHALAWHAASLCGLEPDGPGELNRRGPTRSA